MGSQRTEGWGNGNGRVAIREAFPEEVTFELLWKNEFPRNQVGEALRD